MDVQREEPDEGVVMRVINGILSQGIDGLGPFSSSEVLASQFSGDAGYADTQARVDAMIRWESAKNFGTGFLSGLGGLITLPVTIPMSLYASWIVQARLAGAIAHLHGYSTRDERVRTLILLSLIGDAGKELMKEFGVKLGNKMAMKALEAVPGRLFIEINKRVGFRLITKAGEKGLINVLKMVPLAGGVVGGSIDAVGCRTVGRTADSIFRPATG
jgi:hypothetical protein